MQAVEKSCIPKFPSNIYLLYREPVISIKHCWNWLFKTQSLSFDCHYLCSKLPAETFEAFWVCGAKWLLLVVDLEAR